MRTMTMLLGDDYAADPTHAKTLVCRHLFYARFSAAQRILIAVFCRLPPRTCRPAAVIFAIENIPCFPHTRSLRLS